jgi:malonyl-CoA decarboxylase
VTDATDPTTTNSRRERVRGRIGLKPTSEASESRIARRGDSRAASILHGLATRIRETSILGGETPTHSSLDSDDVKALREEIALAVEGRGGEPLARARAAELGRRYLTLDMAGRITFLTILARDHSIDSNALLAAVRRYNDEAGEAGLPCRVGDIKAALVAPSARLLQRFSALDDGVQFLLVMREDALSGLPDHPDNVALEEQLRELLGTWFDVGFLELRRVTWDSPASLLERLAKYEAVHSIRDWNDLKHRLDVDRRVYGFFHPRMPLEPLIFVEVALLSGIPDAIGPLLDEGAPALDPAAMNTAAFYSITNAQRGLDGISLGGLLIKQVVDELHRDFPRLRTFVTLSPIPGFRNWLGTWEGVLVDKREAAALEQVWPDWTPEAIVSGAWRNDDARADAVRSPLVRACATYLLDERRSSGAALDRVAHFHIFNGARVEQINWLGDRSERGFEQSLGIMVNYLYNLAEIEDNHEAYTSRGVIAAAGAVADLIDD